MATGVGNSDLQIGVLAERTGVSTKTIRYYEELGLLPEPERSSSGYRLYGQTDAERLDFIKRVKQLGFSLGEIGEILALRGRGDPPCSYVVELLESRAREIDRQISGLEQLKGELGELHSRARLLAPQAPHPGGYCHILEG